MVIGEAEGAVLGVNLEHPTVTNEILFVTAATRSSQMTVGLHTIFHYFGVWGYVWAI